MELKNNRRLILIFAGTALVAVSFAILFFIFYPLIKIEIQYSTGESRKASEEKNIQPVDENFGLVIPKISANAKVIANVDATDSKIYQRELTKGVAHALGSALPNEKGNIFIFSHSSILAYLF